MEDAAGALDRRPDGGGFEEVHLEQPEPRVRSVHCLQVLRLALVLCTEQPASNSVKTSAVAGMRTCEGNKENTERASKEHATHGGS